VPNFWFGILLVLLFSVTLGWFPSGGFPGWSAGIAAGVKSLVLPAFALALPQSAILARLTRSSALEALQEDFVRTARAKGLTERVVLLRHALRNAMLPVVTIIGLSLGFLLSGAVLTETIFGFSGMGRALYDGITSRDYAVIQGFTLVVAVIFLVINLVVDILYGFLDPRIRLS